MAQALCTDEPLLEALLSTPLEAMRRFYRAEAPEDAANARDATLPFDLDAHPEAQAANSISRQSRYVHAERSRGLTQQRGVSLLNSEGFRFSGVR